MAGRPRKMLARVTAMEEAAYRLACDVCEARPRRYADRRGEEGNDELARWWNCSAWHVRAAFFSLGKLLGALERKARLGDEPEQRRLAERGFSREHATTPAQAPST